MIYGLIIIFGILFFFISVKLTLSSLEKMGSRIGDFYPFSVIVKRPNIWSTVFYIVVIAILTTVVVVLSGGKTIIPRLPA
ncbi:hypothetical protein KW795_01285 [Candidatus Microgenomates bacterium]|nr:hypothetical protein [Candidatus Microgenomates bacterium]